MAQKYTHRLKSRKIFTIHKLFLHLRLDSAKFASIGIGPGKTPSKEAATNSTLYAALQAGIAEGEI